MFCQGWMREQVRGASRRWNKVHFGRHGPAHDECKEGGSRVMAVTSWLPKSLCANDCGLTQVEPPLDKNQGSSMKNIRYLKISHSKRRAGFSAWGLAIAIVLGVYGTVGFTAVHAQSTVAKVFGWAPAGQTITAHSSTSGARRHVQANAKGRYTISALPLGIYTVTLEKDGKAVDTRSNIPLTVGGGAEIDFACPHDQCAASANK